MGLTHITVSVANLSKDQPSYEAEFLADTDAIDCFATASVLMNDENNRSRFSGASS